MGKFTYYVIDKIMSLNATFNFILGGRGLGKTYGFKKYAIDQFFKHGRQFIYLRRYKPELRGRGEFMADIFHLYPDYEFRVIGNRLQTATVDSKDEKDREWRTMGFFIALSTANNEKSVPYPNVHTILFDEFIAEKGMTRYLPNEVHAFLNFYSTIDRGSDRVRAFFMANSVSINNPYFLEYRIRPDLGEELQRLADGFIACHFPDSEKFKSEVYATKFGRFIAGTEFGEFAVESGFRDGHSGLTGPKPQDARYMFTLELTDGIITIWSYDVYHFHAQRKRVGSELFYTVIPENMAEDKFLIERNEKILSRIKTAYRVGRMTFDEPSTRNIFLDVFKR